MIVLKMESEGNNDDIAMYLDKISKFLKLNGKSCSFKNVLLLILNNLYNDIHVQNGEISKSEKIYTNKYETYNHFIKKNSFQLNLKFFKLFHGIEKIEYFCIN